MKPDLSIIIPVRYEKYLEKTVDDIFEKAQGSIEVIVVLDGYWPDPPLENRDNLIIIHHGTVEENKGMRQSINAGMDISKGKYLMKTDGHCLFDHGFDTKLIADCKDNWVVIPRRYRLNPEKWAVAVDTRPPIDYHYLTYPFKETHNPSKGFHGDEWRRKYYERQDTLIDNTMSAQGSLYFTSRKWWFKMIAPMNVDVYGPFTNEAQEICNNTWCGGGRVVVNKKTWYAHWHKRRKGYQFTKDRHKFHQAERLRGNINCTNYWLDNKFSKKIHDFEWLIDKFSPVPTWPKNWKEKIKIDRKRFSASEN